ncbi:GNAT family N-acetyltransferase [Vulgatibacter sp.]|uniref:GNAT family N-acetyltransferase n=1 Tax=Vulgatibacter sp. TaxID=1971226 RepID=UPI00356946EE
MHFRPASAADTTFVRELSTEAFAPFGDYRDLLPRWTAVPGVSTWVAVERAPCGFVMVGFYFGDPGRTWVYADLLAIAVSPACRGRGMGRRLLRHAVEVAQTARTSFDVRELRLTVADSNERALHLFATEGFLVSEENHGRYDGGQLALRMHRPL